MKGWSAYLGAAVVGFAVVEGGRALYRNRDKIKRECEQLWDEWERIRGAGSIKDFVGDLSIGNILSSVNSVRGLVGQLGQFK